MLNAIPNIPAPTAPPSHSSNDSEESSLPSNPISPKNSVEKQELSSEEHVATNSEHYSADIKIEKQNIENNSVEEIVKDDKLEFPPQKPEEGISGTSLPPKLPTLTRSDSELERPTREVPKLPSVKKKPLLDKLDTRKCSSCSTIFRGKQGSACPKCGKVDESLGRRSERSQENITSVSPKSPSSSTEKNDLSAPEVTFNSALNPIEISSLKKSEDSLNAPLSSRGPPTESPRTMIDPNKYSEANKPAPTLKYIPNSVILPVETLKKVSNPSRRKATILAPINPNLLTKTTFVNKWDDFLKKKEAKEKLATYLNVFRTFLSALRIPPNDTINILEVVERSKPAMLSHLAEEGDKTLIKNVASVTSELATQYSIFNGVVRLQSIVRMFLCRSKYLKARRLFIDHPELYERNKTFISLIKKEHLYHAQICAIIKEYHEPLSKKSVLSSSDTKTLFSNIEEIADVHVMLGGGLSDIQEKFPSIDEVGTFLMKMAPQLKVYGKYVNNFKTATDILQKNLESNKKFQQFIAEKEQTAPKLIQDIPLKSLLSLPVNHLNTYQYHLKLLTEHTPPGHKGFKDLENAFRMMDAVTQYIGDSLAGASNQAKIAELQKRIIAPKNYVLAKQNKLLQREKFLVQTKKDKYNGYLVLFDKCLLVCKLKKDNLSVKHDINLEHTEISDEVTPVGEADKKGLFCIVIQYSEDHLNLEVNSVEKISLYCEKILTKHFWLDELRNAVNNCQKDRIFGKPLRDIFQRTDTVNYIPFIVKQTVEALLKDDKIKVEGIFRISGKKESMEEMRSKIDKGPQEQQQSRVDFTKVPVHDVTGMLKLFFRMLPEPLFTFDMYPKFMQLYKENEGDDEAIIKGSVRLLREGLPKGNLILTAYMLEFFSQVILHAKENMMKAPNISIVFAPNFIRPQEETIEYSLQVVRINYIFELLVSHFKWVKELMEA